MLSLVVSGMGTWLVFFTKATYPKITIEKAKLSGDNQLVVTHIKPEPLQRQRHFNLPLVEFLTVREFMVPLRKLTEGRYP